MRMEKEFDVARPRAEAAQLLAEDDVLAALFPDTKTDIVARKGNRKTIESHYTALGREGVATFHFDFEPSGDVRFEKVCDGRIWRELAGTVKLVERKDKTRVKIELEGRTKALVPEFTIRGPMQDQLEQMAKALKKRLGAKA
jgi:carbon monoxide dehydrogenase subunit G